jgi:hypothetical protein
LTTFFRAGAYRSPREFSPSTIAAYACKIAAYACKIAIYGCKITIYGCKITIYTCKMAIHSCKVAIHSCKIAKNTCKILTKYGQKQLERSTTSKFPQQIELLSMK